ncbi:MAG: signal recognition particle-docking protein FtsY [Candidatus Latescibacterota bacterium]|nr:signal recognition particle-docking protein FtsY [Candidatus Latescibacterota bacterium]
MTGESTGLFQHLRAGLSRTRDAVGKRIAAVVGDGRLDDGAIDEIEEILLSADVGVETSLAVVETLRNRSFDGDTDILAALKSELEGMLPESGFEIGRLSHRPHVVLVVGVNGVGKTTTIGKLAQTYRQAGHKVLMAACDTFRAGAVAQLEIWAERSGADIVRAQQGADPGAVAFDAVQAAVARNVDVLLVDTAGRLHTKVNLMEELKKVRRSLGKELEGAPHETLLVLDSTTGQNALVQAKKFQDAVELTGLALTKLDGTAKGGIAFALRHELDIPIRLVGVGENIDDLQPFSGPDFVRALLETPP